MRTLPFSPSSVIEPSRFLGYVSIVTSSTPRAPTAKSQHGRTGVFGLDTPGKRGRLGDHALDRPHQPLHKVDIVRGLVHECAAIELPRASPGRLVVILLRTSPAHRAVGDVQPAEASLVERALEQLHRWVEPVLLDHEQPHAGVVTRLHERVCRMQRDGHWLLGDHMLARARSRDTVLRMQSGRRCNHDDITRHCSEHLVNLLEPRHLLRSPCRLRTLRHRVTHGD